MKNEFQLFDKKNKLLTYLFSEIDKVIDNNRKVKKSVLKFYHVILDPKFLEMMMDLKQQF